MFKVTVWNEFVHEQPAYEGGIHGYLKSVLETEEDMVVRTATLQGGELTDELLEDTDVLFWWGHTAHEDVPDELVEKIYVRVQCGMGLIVLHSGHHSKIFKKLMGTPCNLSWMDGARERLWCVDGSHPITAGVAPYIELPREELYGEPFAIPTPDELLYIGWFNSGHVFRSGCVFYRGRGKIFYFQPGHESDKAYHHPEIQKILKNAVRFVGTSNKVTELTCPNVSSLEG